MKKLRSFICLFLGVLLFASPLMIPRVQAAGAASTHILDSILPDEGSRTTGGRTTTAPDPADGLPFMGGEEETRGSERGNARDGGTVPMDESTSVGIAILVACLSAIAVIIAVFYVFRGRRDKHRRD